MPQHTRTNESRYAENERVFIMHALAINGFNQRAAAKWMGMASRTLRYKIKVFRDMGFNIPNILPREQRNKCEQPALNLSTKCSHEPSVPVTTLNITPELIGKPWNG